MNLKLFGETIILNVSLHTGMCVCVCVCERSFKGACGLNPLKYHGANSALHAVTVNGRDAPKKKFWPETEFWMCLIENQNAL